MEKFLQSLPNGIVAAGAVVIFIALLLQFKPFHSACDSQIRFLKEELNPLFFTKPSPQRPEITPPTLYSKYKDKCLKGASLGSCLQWFEALNTLDKKLLSSPSKCSGEIVGLPEVQKVFEESLSIMVRLAWGPKPPESRFKKNSWFQNYHLRSFCNFKDWYENSKGKDAWVTLREDFIKDLPGVESLPREEIWGRSILSTPCAKI